MRKLFSRRRRKYIYGVLVAGYGLAMFIWPQLAPAAPLVLALALALFNLTPEEVAP